METAEGRRLSELSRAIRESSLKRLNRVPAGRENWRLAPGALSFGEIARHLVGADLWLFRKLRDPLLPAMTARAGALEIANRQQYREILAELAEVGESRAKLLASLTGEKLAQTLPDERFGGEVTVWWVIARGNLDHEAHHRGQIAAALRVLEGRGSSRERAPVASPARS